jgi:peptidyl-tRNA hydrolase
MGEGFPRLRLGIRGEAPWDDLAGYVLAPFDSGEEEVVADLVRRAAACAESAVREGVQRAANRFNTSPEATGPGVDQGPSQMS